MSGVRTYERGEDYEKERSSNYGAHIPARYPCGQWQVSALFWRIEWTH